MFSKLFFCLIFLTALTPLYSQEPLAQQLKSIIENKKATVGIAVLYNGKILVTVNDKAGYPMMSTFKFPLALAVLERLDKQGLPLETELFISKPDLHPDTYSPLREARPEGNFKITIGELLKYSVALSDNNEDVAAIQLRKILNQNPKLIKGYHLLALIYIHKGEYEKARKILKKAAKIDKTNSTTLRFLKEVDFQTGTQTSLEPRRFGRRERTEEQREDSICHG